jgi:hypothetical protein
MCSPTLFTHESSGAASRPPRFYFCAMQKLARRAGPVGDKACLVTAAVAVRTAVPATAASPGNVNNLIGIGRTLERRGRHGLRAEGNERKESGDRGKQRKFFAHGVILPVGLTPEN